MTVLLYLFLAAAGGVIGSFAGNLGLRLATDRGWAAGRSSCDHCRRPLAYAETVPVVAYFQAHGHCSACGGAIDRAQPAGEIVGLVLLPGAVALAGPVMGPLIFVMGMALLAASVTDVKTERLPDGLVAIVALLAAALAALAGTRALLTGLAAAIACSIVLQALRWVRRHRTGEPGLGLGDVKLAAAMALWLGLATPWAMAGAAAIGFLWVLIAKPAIGRIAFGPFIATAGVSAGLVLESTKWLAA
ncbi:A24 family peptidase [soil metagenome]